MCTQTRNKKWAALGVTTVVLLGAVWFACRPAVHPRFGRVYYAEVVDTGAGNWQSALAKGVAALLTWLQVPQRPVPRHLQIGSAHLQRSAALHGGYIYFESPEYPWTPQWEFALSPRKRLGEVGQTDLRCEFYVMNDPKGLNIFGPSYSGPTTRTAWEERAIRVPDGQVFFARLATNRSTVYVVQLGRCRPFRNRNGAHCCRLRVQYVQAENQWPSEDARRLILSGSAPGRPE